jgi:hypothetical protein
MNNRFDVIVCGGGPAGLVAAIQAGRAGAKVLLVEKTGMLGGTTTTAAVNALQSFAAYGKQVIAGIGWELTRRAYEECGEPLPDFGRFSPRNGCHVAVVNMAIYAALADEMVVGAGVEPLFHSMPVGARFADPGWMVSLATKTGVRDVAAKVIIDCTGDANLVTLAGLDVERNDELQPGTLVFRLAGYEVEQLNVPAIQAAFEQAVRQGELATSDTGWNKGDISHLLRWRGGNCIHVTGIDGRTSEGRTQAEVAGRKILLRLFRFLRRQPGLEKLTVSFCAAETGIRETVTIKGRKKITAADYESGKVWEDAVCYSFYPVDVHTEKGLVYRPLKEGVVATIPFGAFVPERGRNILAAGRCIAGDKEANSAYRVQSSCMAMGQAAGAAAALAVQHGVDVADVSLADLRSLLRQHGAMVPEPKQ